MKLSWFGLVAGLIPLTHAVLFTEDQLAAIAAADSPDTTERYIQSMGRDRLASPNVLANRPQWSAMTNGSQRGHNISNALDGNPNTYWLSTTTPFPHTVTIDMKQNYWVQGVTYLPRQDGQLLGTIGQHQIYLSTDGTNFGSPIAYGLWHDDNTLKVANFSSQQARYIRVVALSEAGNRGSVTSAADFNIYSLSSNSPANPSTVGAYGPTLNFPTVLVAATVLHTTGAVMGWSSYLWDQFTPVKESGGTTWTTQWNPAQQSVSDAIITSTGHDMFCPGLSRDALGRAIVTGGNNADLVSVWDDSAQTWASLPNMNTPRGYQGQTTLSNGGIFTIGGSFSGGRFLKNGEAFNFQTNKWTSLPGCLVKPMLTDDAQGLYRADNHAWLIATRNGSVLQAGPSKAMNWYKTTGTGGVRPAGTRGNDNDAMNGNFVLYDAVQGLILTVGGSPDYDNSTATSNANILTMGLPGSTVKVQQIQNMHYPRAFANSIALPTGEIFIVGGQEYADPFTDTTPVMTPELFNPTTLTFSLLAPIATIRNYHSTALLLPDASILIGGGGLCGNCSTNKFDAQIYYPPYFYSSNGGSSTRPVINSVSATSIRPGQTITLSTNMAITNFALIRYGTATHALDTDQRRIPLQPTQRSGNTYTVTIPNDSGILIPGAYMIFAVANGVPSISKTIMATN